MGTPQLTDCCIVKVITGCLPIKGSPEVEDTELQESQYESIAGTSTTVYNLRPREQRTPGSVGSARRIKLQTE